MPSDKESFFKGQKIMKWKVIRNEEDIVETMAKISLPRPVRIYENNILTQVRGVLEKFEKNLLIISSSCQKKKQGEQEIIEMNFTNSNCYFAIAIFKGEKL